MFLISALLVTVAVYVLSAIVAEVVLVSPEERLLSPVVRTGFGLLISLLFFSAAWLVMPANHVLLLGAMVLLGYAYAHSQGTPRAWLVFIRARALTHVRALLAMLVCALVFFAPLLISGNFGPFTEGGGDISIYADTAKYLYDRNLTEYGVGVQSFDDYFRNLKDAVGIDPYDRYASIDYSLLNPPAAESAAYRILMARVMCPFFYAPYAMFSFLAGETNYPVFYGFLALVYGLILGAVWSYFRPFGRWASWLSVGLVASSHGLASIFYNVYAAQSLSLAIAALILAALPAIRPFSSAGFRTYGTALVYTLGCYTHYLAVIGPMVFAALFLRREKTPSAPVAVGGKLMTKRIVAVILLVVYVTTMLLIVVGSKESFTLMLNLLNGTFAKSFNALMGDAAAIFSLRWNSFALGILSQQHFLPHMREYEWVMTTAGAAVAAGVAGLLLGLALLGVVAYSSKRGRSIHRNHLIVHGTSIAIWIMNIAVIGSSLYTQAKGTQNLLVYLYVAMVLPLAIACSTPSESLVKRSLIVALGIVLLAFAAMQLTLRVEHATRLGFGEDRSGVTEPSFFSEARRIRVEDPNPLVLVEPRNSADVYTSIQPFFEKRMVPVKHLVLQDIKFTTSPPTETSRVTLTVTVPELIAPADLPHLWYLQPHRVKKTWANRGDVYVWNALRVIELRKPTVFYSGHDFELDFGPRPLGKGSTQQGLFSYLRSGAAMLYLPSGVAGVFKVRMEARDPATHDAMTKEVSESIASGQIDSQTLVDDDGTVLTLTLSVASQAQPRLLTVAKYSGEQWLNVDLRELKDSAQ